MVYDNNYLSKSQQEKAQRIIECVIDGFQLETPPKHSIMGFNPYEEITKLDEQKFERGKKEIKISSLFPLNLSIKSKSNQNRQIDKEIELTRKGEKIILRSNFIKVIFEFDDGLKKLVFMNKLNRNIPLHIWCGVLDFSIKHPIIFGRESKYEYHFGPFEELKSELYEQLETIEDKFPQLFPYKIIESDPIIDLLQIEKNSDKTMDDLRRMIVYNVKKKEDSPLALINSLNHQNQLIRLMKKIPHKDLIKDVYETDIGNIIYTDGIAKYWKIQSEFISRYVSTICIPYKDVTYFLIDQYKYPSKKQCRAIFSLINALKEFESSES
ncbi:MAG: hypothetical protein ACFFCI_08655 [Promethearchaeota archaeon]